MPVQLTRLGHLAVAAVPTELSTMAGRRMREALLARLGPHGVTAVVIAGLSNAYADYTVTFEEYQEQRYEGSSTIYGPHQLQGYIDVLLDLASHLVNGTKPDPVSSLLPGSPRYATVDIEWEVPPTAPPGTYRIVHANSYLKYRLFQKDQLVPFVGTSRNFTVVAPSTLRSQQ